MSTFCKRLKEARRAAGISQERLGIEAGIEPASASARMNQYETGKHSPNPRTVQQIAAALDLPASYFYSEEDDVARMLVLFYRLSVGERSRILRELDGLGEGAS